MGVFCSRRRRRLHGQRHCALFSAAFEQSLRLSHHRSAHRPRHACRQRLRRPSPAGSTPIVRAGQQPGAAAGNSPLGAPGTPPLPCGIRCEDWAERIGRGRPERRTRLTVGTTGPGGLALRGGARGVPACRPSRLVAGPPPAARRRRRGGAMASPEEPLAPPPGPSAPGGDEPGSGKLRPEPGRSAAGGRSAALRARLPEPPGRGRAERARSPRPPPLPLAAPSPGAPGALSARGGGAVAARASLRARLLLPGPRLPLHLPYFWPPPQPWPSLLLPPLILHLPARLPGREGAAAAAAAARGGGGDAGGGGGQEAAPRERPPQQESPRRRRAAAALPFPALRGLLLSARAGPWLPAPARPGRPLRGLPRLGRRRGCPPGSRSRPGPGGGGQTARRPRGAGAALAAAFPLPSAPTWKMDLLNNASCFRRLTECFLSPSKCQVPRSPRRAAGGGPGCGRPGGVGWPATGFSGGSKLGQPGTPGFPRLFVWRRRVSRRARGSPRAWGGSCCCPPRAPGLFLATLSALHVFYQLPRTTDAGLSLFSLGSLGWSRGASFLRGPARCLPRLEDGRPGPRDPAPPKVEAPAVPSSGAVSRRAWLPRAPPGPGSRAWTDRVEMGVPPPRVHFLGSRSLDPGA